VYLVEAAAHDSRSETSTRAELTETVTNFFASKTGISDSPEIYGQAQLISRDLLKRTDQAVLTDFEARIEERKLKDANWTFANRLAAALSLVGALGLSHDDLDRVRAFLAMPMPNLTNSAGKDPATQPETTSQTGSGTPSKNPATRLHKWWSNATKWTKTVFGALAVLAAIIAAIPVILQLLPTPRPAPVDPAVADAKTLNSLNAGELFSAFQRTLKVSPKANVWGRAIQVKVKGGEPFRISDYLFVLHTVYVEAFVGSNDTVDAYTITARTANMPQDIKILGRTYNLGKTTLGNAPLDGITLVAHTCAAHIGAYYEVSNTDEADNVQTVAVGATSTGSIAPFKSGGQFAPCFGPTDSLPVAAGTLGYNRQSGMYEIEERYPTGAYLANSLIWRRKVPINAITITAPGYPVAPEMISLHPQTVALYAPGSYR
jgi:hypothetical protein